MERNIESINYPAKKNYSGNVAVTYDKKRSKRKKWKREMAVMQTLISRFKRGASIIDVPVGTGRFLPFYYDSQHRVLGIDISMDMLRQAKAKALDAAQDQPGGAKNKMNFAIGDAESIPLADKSVDYVICIRLLNWVTKPISKTIIKEFKRVASEGIILGFRSLQPMTSSNFIRLGAADMLPTPRQVSRWFKGSWKLARRVAGKVKRVLKQTVSTKETCDKAKPGTFKGRTLYDEAEMFHLFQQMGLNVCEGFPVDQKASYSKKKVDSYSIYLLTFRPLESNSKQ